MVSFEDILPGLIVGVAVAIGAAVLSGQARPEEVKENALKLANQAQQAVPNQQAGGPSQPASGPNFGPDEVHVPVGGGVTKTATAASPREIMWQPGQDVGTGVRGLGPQGARDVAASAIRGSGFQGDFI